MCDFQNFSLKYVKFAYLSYCKIEKKISPLSDKSVY